MALIGDRLFERRATLTPPVVRHLVEAGYTVWARRATVETSRPTTLPTDFRLPRRDKLLHFLPR
jgi:hypothetical protein